MLPLCCHLVPTPKEGKHFGSWEKAGDSWLLWPLLVLVFTAEITQVLSAAPCLSLMSGQGWRVT